MDDQNQEQQQQGQRPVDRVNSFVENRKQNLRQAKALANGAKKALGLGKKPTTQVTEAVTKQVVKQVVTSGARTIFISAGGSTVLLIILILIMLIPPFGGTGESAGLPGNTRDIPPLGLATSCPVAINPTLNCGSKIVPLNGPLGLCGHCGAGYGGENKDLCNNPLSGISHAIDVGTPNGSPVYFPTILGETIRWTSLIPSVGSIGAIYSYNGTSPTGKQYHIEFHHAQPGSGKLGVYNSGEAAATTCTGAGCTNHIHVELGTGSSSGGPWLEAPDYLCRK